MKFYKLFFAIAIFSVGCAQALHSQSRPAPLAATAPTVVPALVPYTGLAESADGKPLTGEVGVTFLLFKDEAGGEPLWVEGQRIALDATGHYKAQLGASLPSGLPLEVFATGEARWLEVQIAGEKPQPRTLLMSVPYAAKAADAATLGGLPASAFVLAGPVNSVGGTTATPETATTVTTTGGVSGYLSSFSGASTIVDSTIFQLGTKLGVGTTNPGATLDIAGTATVRGTLGLPATGAASTTKGASSEPLTLSASSYSSSTKAATTPQFSLQAEAAGNDTATPSSTLNFLYTNGGTAAETGLSISSKGIVAFAPGQTFPGGGSGSGTITGVTAGTGLTGGGTTGNVTLTLDTTKVPELALANTFTATTETFNGSVDVVGDTRVDFGGKNGGSVSPAIRFGSGNPGEGIASDRTGTINKDGIDFYTNFLPQMSVTHAGTVGINETNPDAQLDVRATSSNDAIQADGTYFSGGFTTNGLYGTGGSGIGEGVMGGSGAYLIGGGGDGQLQSGYGISAYAGQNGLIAGYFGSDIYVNGTQVNAVGATQIDHPLDPANKYLMHSNVQSSEMMNIYTGNVTTDALGQATVTLPDWFEAENADFRYQLTVVGRQAQAWVAEEVGNKQFKIATNATNVKVSWQITAVRQDAYAKAHPLAVESLKPERERGFYHHPELFGQPDEKQTEWARHPHQMQRLKAHREAEQAAAKDRLKTNAPRN